MKIKCQIYTSEGSGYCNILASASIMTDLMKEKKKKVKRINRGHLQMIKRKPKMKTKIINENEKTQLMSLSGVKQYLMSSITAYNNLH